MWTDGRRKKTNPKTSPEQSGKLPYPPGIYKTNLFTKFHDDWTNNVTSRVFTSFFYYINIRKLPPPPGSHVIQLTRTIFKLNSCIKETNVLTKFHENWAKNVTSRVFTCFHYIHIMKNAPPTGVHVFTRIWTIFILIRDINKTNVLTNFHDDWAKIVTSRVFTGKTAPPTGGHVFQRTGNTFELNQHIIKADILTNNLFHEDRTINVASRVFTNKCGQTDDGQRPVIKAHLSNHFHDDWTTNVTSRGFTSFFIRKKTPPLGGYVFLPIRTIFELDRRIQETSVLTKFHEDWTKNVSTRLFTCFPYIHIEKTSPPPGGHVCPLITTIFKLVQVIHIPNAKNVTSRVKMPPPVGHVFLPIRTIFELNHRIQKTNVLTKFHEDWAKKIF
ncbi:hypothetical protein DPMN_066005 [Dreissena polymorpha]|uniref:Uncharacterized protein n=1 Tax=Dreissena polymorpha TaxID=45954 RepID=A0A9D3YXJ2_DREPO|nr:hypothetical protein DPMN_066005 [Dreissena polymorpha]